MWEQVYLLDLAELPGQGGLGTLGLLGALIFFPNSQEVKSSRTWFYIVFTITYTTKALLWIRVSTPVKEPKDSSLTRGAISTSSKTLLTPRRSSSRWRRRLSKCQGTMPSPSHLATLKLARLRERWLGRWRPSCGFCQVTPPVWGTHLHFHQPLKPLWPEPIVDLHTLWWKQLQSPRAAQLLLQFSSRSLCLSMISYLVSKCLYLGGLSCLMILVLLTWVEFPGSRVSFPLECQAKNKLSLWFQKC